MTFTEGLIPCFAVPLHREGFSLTDVLPAAEAYRAPLLVTEALAAVANHPLRSAYASDEEHALMSRLTQLSGLPDQPEEFLVEHLDRKDQIIYLRPNFDRSLRQRLYLTDSRPPFISFRNGENLVLAAATDRNSWQYLSLRTDQSSFQGLITAALRVVLENAEPANLMVLSACEATKQDSGRHRQPLF